MSDFDLFGLLLSLICLLGLAHALGYAAERFGIPRVIGEIGAGLILGPSLFGWLLPETQQAVFAAFPSQDEILQAFYWLGLIALMFTSGFRVQRRMARDDAGLVAVIIVGATALPFLAGWLAPQFMDFSPYTGPNGAGLPLVLIVAIAFSVTSIPVISKIFLDLGIMQTRFARIVLAAATVQDLLLWVALSVATEIALGGTPTPDSILRTVAITLLFLAGALIFGPRLLGYISRMRFNLVIKASVTGYLFVVCFILVAIAGMLSVNLVFGALVAGIVVGSVSDDRFEPVKERIGDISSALFVPIYFALVGFGVNLASDFDIGFTLAFIAVSSAIEIASVMIACRLVGRDLPTSVNFALAMNTRGGPGIVLASVALAAGIISPAFYVTLVLAAIATSLVSGAWFRWVQARGRPLMS